MTENNRPSHAYDVCLSFAGEDRDYVREVAEELKYCGIRVFYDEYEEVALWGKDLHEHLDDIYKNAARYCVLFVSKHYSAKVWTIHERRSAQERALSEHSEYMLPARFDQTPIPGLRNTVGYIDLRGRAPKSFAALIRAKIKGGSLAYPAIVTVNSISTLLKGFTHERVFVGDTIPLKKLDNAIKKYAPNVSPKNVYLLYDNTIFGSAKEGVLLTNDGVYWRGNGGIGHRC
jgi:hypothetical protein